MPNKTVTAAGTPERLSSTSVSGQVTVGIQALGTNTGKVAVGDSDVDATTQVGFLLDVTDGVGDSISIDRNPASIWVDAAVNGEGVTYVVLDRTA